MKKQIGLLALAVVMGLGLTQSGLGQGPPAGMVPGQGPAMRGGGSGGRGAGSGFNCPYRQAALGATTGTVALGYGRGMGRGTGMRRNAAFGPGPAATGAAAGASNTAPGVSRGMGMRRNAPVAPGTGPFCPFNPHNSAATGNAAATGSQTGSTPNSQPATK